MEALVRYTRHLLHTGSLYPVMTFWLVICIAITATWKEWISHGEAIVLLFVTALILIIVADKRDTRHEVAVVAADLKKETQAVSAELSGKVAEVHELVNHASDLQDARIQQLIEVIKVHGIVVPPPPAKPLES
jgi:hypothetical protein